MRVTANMSCFVCTAQNGRAKGIIKWRVIEIRRHDFEYLPLTQNLGTGDWHRSSGEGLRWSIDLRDIGLLCSCVSKRPISNNPAFADSRYITDLVTAEFTCACGRKLNHVIMGLPMDTFIFLSCILIFGSRDIKFTAPEHQQRGCGKSLSCFQRKTMRSFT